MLALASSSCGRYLSGHGGTYACTGDVAGAVLSGGSSLGQRSVHGESGAGSFVEVTCGSESNPSLFMGGGAVKVQESLGRLIFHRQRQYAHGSVRFMLL